MASALVRGAEKVARAAFVAASMASKAVLATMSSRLIWVGEVFVLLQSSD